jgi:hypothetical protein
METYCAIYVYTALPFEELRQRTAEIVDGAITLRTIEGSGLVIDVLKNDDFDEQLAAGGSGDFVFFPYKLEVEPDGDVDWPDARRELTSLLAGLKREGFDFVTAADFEDELPDMGRSRPGPLSAGDPRQ